MRASDWIRGLYAASTRGRWWDARRFFQTKHAKRVQNNQGWDGRDWRALPGDKIRNTWVQAIFAERPGSPESKIPAEAEFDPITHRLDEWDFQHVAAIQWWQIKGTSIGNGALSDADAAIACALHNVAPLVADLIDAASFVALASGDPLHMERLRASLAALNAAAEAAK